MAQDKKVKARRESAAKYHRNFPIYRISNEGRKQFYD
jgi:hypothetical protein